MNFEIIKVVIGGEYQQQSRLAAYTGNRIKLTG